MAALRGEEMVGWSQRQGGEPVGGGGRRSRAGDGVGVGEGGRRRREPVGEGVGRQRSSPWVGGGCTKKNPSARHYGPGARAGGECG